MKIRRKWSDPNRGPLVDIDWIHYISPRPAALQQLDLWPGVGHMYTENDQTETNTCHSNRIS